MRECARLNATRRHQVSERTIASRSFATLTSVKSTFKTRRDGDWATRMLVEENDRLLLQRVLLQRSPNAHTPPLRIKLPRISGEKDSTHPFGIHVTLLGSPEEASWHSRGPDPVAELVAVVSHATSRNTTMTVSFLLIPCRSNKVSTEIQADKIF